LGAGGLGDDKSSSNSISAGAWKMMGHHLEPLDRVDTFDLFDPLHQELVQLLSGLSAAQWVLPTVAGSWAVRDIVAHLIDGQMRRLSFQRDRLSLPSSETPLEGYDSLVAYLNHLNALWVRTMRRVSTRQLLTLLDRVGQEYSEFVTGLNPEDIAFFPVAWAGEDESLNWMDLGRDYTELWHHQEQIRDAVGAPPLTARRWVHPVFDLGIRGVYRAWRDLRGDPGSALLFSVEGDAGGEWSIVWDEGWTVLRGAHPDPRAHVSASPEAAWKLLFNALDRSAAKESISVSGDPILVSRFLDVRAVLV
jgi:hypothetical protein